MEPTHVRPVAGVGDPGSRAQVGRRQWEPLAIVAAVLLAYANSFTVPFLFDDFPQIANNATIRHLADLPRVLSPPAFSGASGRPLLNLSYALNYAVGGDHVVGYHAVNLGLHVIAALLLYGLLRRTLASSATAFSAALLWSVHPLLTGAVTYLSERAEVLMGVFYLLTLYSLVRIAEPGASRRGWTAIGIAACYLGMLTKEVMVTVPVVAFLFDAACLSGSFREAWRRRKAWYMGLISSWVVVVLALHFGRHSIGYGRGAGLLEYALTECRAILIYLKLALWPHPLVFDYGPLLVGPGDTIVPYVIVVLALLALAMGVWIRRPAVGILGVFFFLLLAPTSSIVPVVLQPIAESRMYLPLATIVIAVVLLAGRWLGPRIRWIACGLAVLFVIASGVRNARYQSAVSIWSDTVDKRPRNARAQVNLGIALEAAGRIDDAIVHYREGYRLTPNSKVAREYLGATLHQRGGALLAEHKLPEARACYAEALQVDPGYPPAMVSLAVADLALGNLREAQGLLTAALRIDPNNPEAHLRLGNLLAVNGQVDQAIDHWKADLRSRPDDPEAHTNLGVALARSGHAQEAAQEFSAALRADPNYLPARQGLDYLQAQGESPGLQH